MTSYTKSPGNLVAGYSLFSGHAGFLIIRSHGLCFPDSPCAAGESYYPDAPQILVPMIYLLSGLRCAEAAACAPVVWNIDMSGLKAPKPNLGFLRQSPRAAKNLCSSQGRPRLSNHFSAYLIQGPSTPTCEHMEAGLHEIYTIA